MDSINHEIKINTPAESVYKALSTQNGIKSWFTPNVEGDGTIGSEWKLRFKNQPEFHWKILTSDVNKRIVWECLKGPGNSIGTSVIFDILPIQNEKTLLVVSHLNWPDNDQKFRECNTLWGIIVHHLKQFVESNISNPVYN